MSSDPQPKKRWWMRTYRCDWCGRFYSSPLPDPSACDDHLYEHGELLKARIEKHNAKMRANSGEV
jgi:hypothetical protein